MLACSSSRQASWPALSAAAPCSAPSPHRLCEAQRVARHPPHALPVSLQAASKARRTQRQPQSAQYGAHRVIARSTATSGATLRTTRPSPTGPSPVYAAAHTPRLPSPTSQEEVPHRYPLSVGDACQQPDPAGRPRRGGPRLRGRPPRRLPGAHLGTQCRDGAITHVARDGGRAETGPGFPCLDQPQQSGPRTARIHDRGPRTSECAGAVSRPRNSSADSRCRRRALKTAGCLHGRPRQHLQPRCSDLHKVQDPAPRLYSQTKAQLDVLEAPGRPVL